jgi:hypothetical protein
VESSHPISTLLAFIDSEYDESDVAAVRDAVTAIVGSRDDWLLGPPQFVDQAAEDGGRDVGAVLYFYSSFDENGRLLDEASDRAAMEDARAFIEGLAPVSAEKGIDIGFELDLDSIGWIEKGEVGEDLRVGLLEAWADRFA